MLSVTNLWKDGMIKMNINIGYLTWLVNIATNGSAECTVYHKLFSQLMDTPFKWIPAFPLDENRAADGISLRGRYAKHTNNPYPMCADVNGEPPASVLEVLVALASRIENEIMHNGEEGDRTSCWFFNMLRSLGLNCKNCVDDSYDAPYVNAVLERFMCRGYAPNGMGGLFTITSEPVNMLNLEIWAQANKWLMTEIVNK